MMAHVEVEALEKFPIEKLSYDLKLELLENMRPRDVVELVNVNQGFRSIVVREPWRIFGKDVEYIAIMATTSQNRDRSEMEIKKFESRIDMSHDNRISLTLSGSSSHLMEVKTHSILVSKIRTCQKLRLRFDSKKQGQETAQLSTNLLGNLDAVEELAVWLGDVETDIEKYLTILASNHFNRATFKILFDEGIGGMLGFWSNFFETRLNHCKSIEIGDYSGQDSSLWFESLSKIWTEVIMILGDGMDFGGLIHQIVARGIPSTNSEAAIILYNGGAFENSIADFLPRTPKVCQIAQEDRGEVEGILGKLLLDESIPEGRRDVVEDCLEGVYLAGLIDSNRKWIYATDRDHCLFAKYITIG